MLSDEAGVHENFRILHSHLKSFLDLRIRRFTRAIEPMLNLVHSDVGRPITDFQPQVELPDLRRILLDAMDGGKRTPRDIRDSHGCWYSLRVLPSVGLDGKCDGAVLVLIDNDAAKRGLDFAEAIVETVRRADPTGLHAVIQEVESGQAWSAMSTAARSSSRLAPPAICSLTATRSVTSRPTTIR